MSTSVSMTSTLPRPPLAPPKGPLPALPIPKTRNASADGAEDARPATGLGISTPSKLPPRSVTLSALPTPKPKHSQSTPAVPTLNTAVPTVAGPKSATASNSPSPATASSLPTPGKTVRKTSSIGAFPLPPKVSQRVSSLPPSPLSAAESASDPNGQNKSRRESAKSPVTPSTEPRRPRSGRSSGYGVRARTSLNSNVTAYGKTPSLLNGSGEKSAIAGTGSRASDSFLTLPSPPQSRSSSANDSYHTDATHFEENGEERGRPKSVETITATAMSVASTKRSSGTKDSAKGNVIVSVRVRPDAASGEKSEGEWMVDGRRSLISYQGKEGGDYRYDNVFSPHDNNARVYDSAAKRLVRRVMEGYHGTVFAYGMTGTGKTFSMQGTANSPGVIPLAITDIFSYIRENPNREFLLRVSYLEIYNEKIYDLLNQSTPGQTQQEEIKLREDSKRGVYATPLKEEIVQSPNQLLRVIARGDMARRTGSTQFNARSSRSHAVVQIVVESRERTPSHGAYYDKETRRQDRIMPGGVLVSTLSLIDLAGSERAAEDKERRTEGAHINKSLLTLGTVIARLSNDDEKDASKEEKDGKAADKDKGTKHLPYRDSKLTRLLQPALSGNSLVSILCTIQLSSAGTSAAKTTSHVGETLNTLKFASRAKNNIVSHAKRNESNANGGDAGSRALLDRYRMEIQELRAQLDNQSKVKKEEEPKDDIEQDREKEEELERQEKARHEEQMLEMQLARTALKERISHLNRLILSSKSLGVNSGSGRFSSASVPLNRMSSFSALEYGRPVSVRSRDSLQSQIASRRESAATLDVLPSADPNLKRTLSNASLAFGPNASAVAEETNAIEEDELEASGDAEGNASLAQQNRMLQADLADKNRYIATLEKRLIQARRTSHSRVSMQYSKHAGPQDENGFQSALVEKDREIEELRAKLDDQMRMVNALRSAARKREMNEKIDNKRNSQQSEGTVHAITTNGTGKGDMELILPARVSSRASARSSRIINRSSHRSTPSNASRSSSGIGNYSKPLSPVALLSPTLSAFPEGVQDPVTNADSKTTEKSRRKSVDEMTMLLDQMIQDKVESGHVVRGDRGSLRIKRDTVMERAASEAVAGTPDAQTSTAAATEVGHATTTDNNEHAIAAE